MRFFFIVIFIVCIGSNSIANPIKIDSLINRLNNSNQKNYLKIFKSVEAELLAMSPSPALKKAQGLNLIAYKLNFNGPLSSAYRCLALAYDKNKQPLKALQAIERAQRLSNHYNLPIESANNLRALGKIYHNSGKYNFALTSYFESLKIYEQTKNQQKEIYLIYSYLGDIYYKTQHYQKSKEYFLKAYKLGKKSLDNGTLINILNTIALIHGYYKDYNQAINYHREALRLAKISRDSIREGTTNANIGRVFQLQNKYDYALMYFERGVALSEKFKDWNDLIITLSRIGAVYLEEKQYSKAKIYLERASTIAEKEKEYDAKVFLYEVLARYYRETNDINKAFAYQRLYTEVKDSIQRKSFIEEIDQIRSSFEIDKKQSQIVLLRKKNAIITASQQKTNFMLLLTIILLVLIVIATLMLYRSNRQKVKTNTLLKDQQLELFDKNEEINVLNEGLEKMVQERTRQLQEAIENLVKQNHNLEQFSFVISHNLRSPIAHILGLISIFDRKKFRNSSNLEVLDHLDKAAQNLDEIVGDLNGILLIRNHSEDSKEEISLTEVAKLTIESLRSQINESQANITLDFSEIEIMFTNKSYLNSILYNLLSNAIKYRALERAPEIQIRSVKEEKYVCLIIKDNGMGMELTKTNTEKLFMLYQRLHIHTEGKGMGLFIVKEQLESLKGKIEVESELDQGTTFKVYFPYE